jgi:hypothetical protein
MWSARVHEAKKCVHVWNTLSQLGDSARVGAQWFPSALSLWELHSCGSPEYSESWLKRQTSTKLGPQDTILKCRCLKCPHIVHFDMGMHELWLKEEPGIKLKFWLPTTNPLKGRVKWFMIGPCNTQLKIFF